MADPTDPISELVRSLIAAADTADVEARDRARDQYERAKTAWAEGWQKGLAGLLDGATAAKPPESSTGPPPSPG